MNTSDGRVPQLNTVGPVPLYYQIKQYIDDKIDNGELKPGDEIPGENDLADLFRVSRPTVRRAVQELANEGVLIKRRGKRTIVAPRKIDQPLSRIIAFSDTVRHSGMTPKTQSLEISYGKLDIALAELLGGKSGETVVKIERLRMADDTPISIITSYILHDIVPGIVEKGLINDSLYRTLTQRYGVKLDVAEQVIEAKAASVREAQLLSVPKGFPLLKLTQLSIAENGRPIEAVIVLTRSDRYRYRTNLTDYDRLGNLTASDLLNVEDQ